MAGYRECFCNGPEHVWRPNRREFLFVGLVGSLGLTLDGAFRLQAQSAAARARAQSVINIFLPGGIAAQESFDPKLLAPIEYRGPLGTVKTRLEGVHFSETLKQTALVADKICVVRAMTHGEADHDRGTHNMFTGWRPSPAVVYPSLGSIVSHELGSRNDLPPYVCIPSQPNSFAGTGFLGSAYGPFSLGADPADASFQVRDLNLPEGVDEKRFAQRREMRAAVDAHFSSLEKSDALDGMDSFYQRAYAMISSDKARAAFDLKQEADKLRDEYGRNAAGQRMLLARRLVESGVRFVSLTYGSWDHHDNIRNGITSQMPAFDQAFAALLRDLEGRGLLDSTLVLVTTEFGRTPKVNGTGGRDHYPKVFSIVMAGSGIKKGYIHGSTDPTGSEPDTDPLNVPDYAATIYHLLGIDWEKTLTAGTRPVKIIKDGEVAKGLLILLLLLSTLSPQLSTCCRAAAPQLASMLPAGGQRGTELELTLSGERLQDAEEILCYETGLQVLKLTQVTNSTVKAQVKIAPDCSLGEHHLRLRAASGLSELRTFFVGPFPVVAEVEPNNEAGKAQKVALNTTVTGVITSEDLDCFAVEAKKGQRISAEVEGIRLGRAAFDPRLTLSLAPSDGERAGVRGNHRLLDTNGVILDDVVDTWLGQQDPFLSLVASRDGTYLLQVREATYGGNDNCHYRLHIGTFARPTTVYPLGGKVGETLWLTNFSEAGGLFSQQVKLPDTPQEKSGIFPELEGVPAPTANWIRVCEFPNVLEVAPNQDREHATVTELQPPLAFNGVISRPQRRLDSPTNSQLSTLNSQLPEEDWFRFPAAKGVALEVAVYARRLRSPLDSVLEVLDAKGQSVASNDDATGADSALKFTPAESTNYFVRIRDALGQGGPDFTYRIEITPVQPSLGVKIPEVARNDTQSRQFIVVPRGNRFATLLSAKRADFSSDLVFNVEGLPTGVTLLTNLMPASIDAMPLVFEAAADAPIAGKLLDLVASGTNGTNRVTGKFRQEVMLVEGPNNTSYYGTSVEKLCVAVTKEAPFKLRIVQPSVPLVQAGAMRLEIVAERTPGFEEPIDVQMVWSPPGMSAQPEVTIPKGATNVFYPLNASGDAQTRTWKIAVLGHATVEGGALYVSSQLADLEVAAPFVTGKIETLWVNPGKSGKLTVNLQQAKAFEGKAIIRLSGLPEKVSTAEKEFSKEDQEVVFDVAVAPDCPTGSHKNLFCSVEIQQSGQVVPHTIAAGGILRIVPPKKEEPKPAPVAQEKK